MKTKLYKKGDKVRMTPMAIREEMHLPTGITTGTIAHSQRTPNMISVQRDGTKSFYRFHVCFWMPDTRSISDRRAEFLKSQIKRATNQADKIA